MSNREDFGLLVTPDTKLQRIYFKEMCQLRGVRCKYQYPLNNKDYSINGELQTGYSEPENVYCILNENIDQATAKKLGWNAEQVDKLVAISVPYDLHDIQVGCLFEVPSAFENAPGRRFRVVSMNTIAVYPASITCQTVLEYDSVTEKAEVRDFTESNFNLLNDEEWNVWR